NVCVSIRVAGAPGVALGSVSVIAAETGAPPSLSRSIPRTDTPSGTANAPRSVGPVTSIGSKLTATGRTPYGSVAVSISSPTRIDPSGSPTHMPCSESHVPLLQSESDAQRFTGAPSSVVAHPAPARTSQQRSGAERALIGPPGNRSFRRDRPASALP